MCIDMENLQLDLENVQFQSSVIAIQLPFCRTAVVDTLIVIDTTRRRDARSANVGYM